jgi:hypothetical protein
MDLLRRAFTEHPVAAAVVGGVEIAAFVIVVSIIAGHVVVSYAAIAALVIGLAFLGWRKRRTD